MWKHSLGVAVLSGMLYAVSLLAQAPGLPPGPLQEKARRACLGCHDARIIVQQQLDRRAWTKEVEKMMRWGAPIAPEDKEAMIDYFVKHFGPRAAPPGAAQLAAGEGAEKVRAACLGCHDAGIIVEQNLDRRQWTRTLDKMIHWGAAVRPGDRDAILNYLATHYASGPKPDKEER